MSDAAKLLDLYVKGGPSTVFHWVHANRPDWDWGWCGPCEEDTPTLPTDDVCAVCWSERDPSCRCSTCEPPTETKEKN